METTSKQIDTDIGANIRKRRNLAGLSQEHVAMRLGNGIGISFQQLQKYEKGKNRVSASRLIELANVIECGVADFFKGVDPYETTKAPDTITLRLADINIISADNGGKAFVEFPAALLNG